MLSDVFSLIDEEDEEDVGVEVEVEMEAVVEFEGCKSNIESAIDHPGEDDDVDSILEVGVTAGEDLAEVAGVSTGSDIILRVGGRPGRPKRACLSASALCISLFRDPVGTVICARDTAGG